MTTDIAELRRRLAAATPGPWMVSSAAIGCFKIVETAEQCADPHFCPGLGHCYPYGPGGKNVENTALIVAAVNALPALLDEITALRAVEDIARGLAIQRDDCRKIIIGVRGDHKDAAMLEDALAALDAAREGEK